MLAGTRRLHRRVECQQVGLAGDLLHDQDLLGDGLHRTHRLGHGPARSLGVARRIAGDALGLGGVVGVLLDVGGHLLHRGRGLLGRGRLLGGPLAELLGGRRHLLAAGSHVAHRTAHLTHHLAQLARHIARRSQQARIVSPPRRHLNSEITGGNLPHDFLGIGRIPAKLPGDVADDPDCHASRHQHGEYQNGQHRAPTGRIGQLRLFSSLIHELALQGNECVDGTDELSQSGDHRGVGNMNGPLAITCIEQSRYLTETGHIRRPGLSYAGKQLSSLVGVQHGFDLIDPVGNGCRIVRYLRTDLAAFVRILCKDHLEIVTCVLIDKLEKCAGNLDLYPILLSDLHHIGIQVTKVDDTNSYTRRGEHYHRAEGNDQLGL